MIFPTIHLNGTSREALAAPLREAHEKLGEALAALEACAPHGRDYYPQGPQALRAATREFIEQRDRVSHARGWVAALLEHVE